MGRLLTALLALLVLVCLVLAALCLARARAGLAGTAAHGGASAKPRPPPRPRRTPDPAKSAHLVVDTLNLAHWLRPRGVAKGTPLTPAEVVAAIDAATPTLKARHPGNLVFVLKDRESQFTDEAARAAYREAAVRNKVTVALAERYEDPPAGAKPSAAHSSRGRDDFYVSLLARRLRCAVLTADKLRDFAEFRGTVPPFHVVEFTFWRDQPSREYVRPDSPAYRAMRKPRLVHPAEYFLAERAGAERVGDGAPAKNEGGSVPAA